MEYIIQGKTLDGIADTIRKMTGKTDKMRPTEFAVEIASITGDVKPTLFTPSVVLDGGTSVLTITDDGNGDFERWYMLYANGTKVATVSSKTVTLPDYIDGDGYTEIKVQVAAANFTSSEFSNIVGWYAATIGLAYTLSEDGTYAIYSGIGTSTTSSIVIDSMYNGVPVTELAAMPAAAENVVSHVTSMFIPYTVEKIATSGYFTSFELYPNLENIIVDEGNNTYSSIDGNLYSKDATTLLVYSKGKSDTSFVIPNSVTTVRVKAFSGCSRLSNITIPDSVVSIEFGDGIGTRAFNGCVSLRSIDVSNGNESYQSIDGNLYSKDGKEFLLYAKGKTAREFTVPNGVVEVESIAFSDCDNLESIVIPDTVTSIGAYAFEDCANLRSIAIGSGYTVIGMFTPFSSCPNLKRIDFSRSGSVVSTGFGTASSVFSGSHADLQIKVPASLLTEWKSNSKWSGFADRIVTEFTNTL